MSQGRAIDPLPLQDFPTEADTQDPGFEQLFSDLVADAGTPADGFEDDLAIANSLLDSLDAALTEMSGQTGGTLDDTFLEILSVDPAPAGDDVVNLSAAIPGVQTNVDNLGNYLAGAAAPTPPQPVTSLPPGCSAVAGFGGTGQPLPQTRAFVFSIAGPNTILTVDSITLDQDTPGTFSLTHDPTPAVYSGVVFNFSVTLNQNAPTGIRGKITTTYHLQDNVSHSIVLCLGVATGDLFPQPSSGGGSPPTRPGPAPPPRPGPTPPPAPA